VLAFRAAHRAREGKRGERKESKGEKKRQKTMYRLYYTGTCALQKSANRIGRTMLEGARKETEKEEEGEGEKERATAALRGQMLCGLEVGEAVLLLLLLGEAQGDARGTKGGGERTRPGGKGEREWSEREKRESSESERECSESERRRMTTRRRNSSDRQERLRRLSSCEASASSIISPRAVARFAQYQTAICLRADIAAQYVCRPFTHIHLSLLYTQCLPSLFLSLLHSTHILG
jgi:hypothetical protein